MAGTPAGAATTSAPEPYSRGGRLDAEAAAARTEELYAQYRRLVNGLCSGLLRNRAEAEDAAQQTFLAAHRALLNGSTPREPAAWLATIARNECWARIRARMREPLPTDGVDATSAAPDPLAEAIRRADLAALWRAIAELPRQQRDALLLREFGGLSYDELAEALAVTGPAVESLLFRARQGVRARLQTAYAALSGVGWVEALTRLLAGASSTAAPLAAKAVVVAGIGGAVAAGGVVVAPRVLDHHRTSPPRPARVAPAAVRTATPVKAAVSEHAATTRKRSDDSRDPSGPGSDGSRDQGRTVATIQDGRDGSGDGGSRHGSETVTTSAAGVSGSDGGGDRSGSGSSGDGGHSGSGSSGGGDSQPQPTTTSTTTTQTTSAGVTLPAPNPPVTVVPPPSEEPPGGDG